MSVIVFSNDEVAALNRHAQAVVAHLLGWSRDRANELACAFRAVHIAQAAAAAMTYGEGFVIPEPFEWDGAADVDGCPGEHAYLPHPDPCAVEDVSDLRQLGRLIRGIDHARYNTVSNGGTDFLPLRYADVLDALELELRDTVDDPSSMTGPARDDSIPHGEARSRREGS